jgi:ankyrin repeat protein
LGLSCSSFIGSQSLSSSPHQADLILAVKYGTPAIVRMLIETNKVDLNARDHQGLTALMIAAHKGHMAIVKILVEAGADVMLTQRQGMTAYALASTPEIKEYLKQVMRT